jgi:hypothetical protein
MSDQLYAQEESREVRAIQRLCGRNDENEIGDDESRGVRRAIGSGSGKAGYTTRGNGLEKKEKAKEKEKRECLDGPPALWSLPQPTALPVWRGMDGPSSQSPPCALSAQAGKPDI